HDLDAGEVALVDRPIVRLAGEGLLMDPSLGRAVEEAAVARFELEHSPGRLHDQRPHELLVVDPAAARERVEEVRVERVGRRQHGVVAALHHARAARAPQQSLDDDRDGQARRSVGGVERGAEPSAPGAEVSSPAARRVIRPSSRRRPPPFGAGSPSFTRSTRANAFVALRRWTIWSWKYGGIETVSLASSLLITPESVTGKTRIASAG